MKGRKGEQRRERGFTAIYFVCMFARVDINSYTLFSLHHSFLSTFLPHLLSLFSLSLFTSCFTICPSHSPSSIPPKFLSRSHSHSITPPPLRIPTSLSLSFSISTSLHHTSPHPRPPQPSSSLSVVTAACLMVQLLLSRSTKRRPGERQPRLTPPNRWPYQD